MRPIRPLRWRGLLVLPLLVGALLLMHGLDARAGADPASPVAAPVAASSHPHHADPAGQDHGHCEACAVGHVMAACVAILTVVAGVALVRRHLGWRVAASAGVGPRPGPTARTVLRPPEPAWVRLAVMRC